MANQAQILEYKIYLSTHLSKKRYTHSLNVADEAVRLAETYNADIEKAYLAGLLHDVCKEMPLSEQKEYILVSDRDVCKVERKSSPLWHSIAGAVFLNKHFNINDEDILNSVRYHTAGRAEMTILEKIIYLADLISIDRNYKDVNKMRRICYKDIDKAMIEALRFSICDTVSKSNTIPLTTLNAYNYYSQL